MRRRKEYVAAPLMDTEELRRQENKTATKLTELGSVECPSCRKKLVRVFAPRSGLRPVFRGDVQDYMGRMRNAMADYDAKGAKSLCHISGPEYTVVFNAEHFSKPYCENLGTNNRFGYCGYGAYLGYSAVEVASRIFLRQRSVRMACILNGVEPEEVRAHLEAMDSKVISSLFGYNVKIAEVEGTDLWAGIFRAGTWGVYTVGHDAIKVTGAKWAAELDPVLANPPPASGYARSKYTMSPSQGGVHYVRKRYSGEIMVDLPHNTHFNDLKEYGGGRIIDVCTPTGMSAKIQVNYDGRRCGSMDPMTKAFEIHKIPRKFWVIQPSAFMGTSSVESGDLVL